jgi:hypothetical protein
MNWVSSDSLNPSVTPRNVPSLLKAQPTISAFPQTFYDGGASRAEGSRYKADENQAHFQRISPELQPYRETFDLAEGL